MRSTRPSRQLIAAAAFDSPHSPSPAVIRLISRVCCDGLKKLVSCVAAHGAKRRGPRIALREGYEPFRDTADVGRATVAKRGRRIAAERQSAHFQASKRRARCFGDRPGQPHGLAGSTQIVSKRHEPTRPAVERPGALPGFRRPGPGTGLEFTSPVPSPRNSGGCLSASGDELTGGTAVRHQALRWRSALL